jgi:predicted TIM-barrel fold metal-dependent hydrolase
MAAIAKSLTEFPLFTPPPRRYHGPIVDAHMHTKDVATIQAYWDVAEPIYGIRHVVAIVDLATAIDLKKVYGSRVQPAVWAIAPRPEKENLSDLTAFRKEKEAHLERIAEEGFRIIKLWFTPRFYEWSHLRLDDPALDFFFERVNKLRLAILIHVADPDVWFAHKYTDVAKHGSKLDQYPQLTRRLEQYPEIVVQGAHFGGDPEHLDHLASLLEHYPNLYLDSSATKWVSREFSKHGPAGREFLTQFSDRVLFGTDLVANPEREKEGPRDHYATRFYVHQLMWEQSGTFDSPIEDEDSADPPRLEGLALPEAVLAKFYWENAARLYGFSAKALTP